MNLQTKKKIAKEFLILVLTLTLGLLSFLCTFPYNQYKYNQIENFDRTIKKRQKTVDSLTIADSLNKIENNISPAPVEDQTPPTHNVEKAKRVLYNTLTNKVGYTKSYDEFKKQFSNPVSIGRLYDRLIRDNLYSKSADDFNQQFFPEVKPVTKPAEQPVTESDPEKGNPVQSAPGGRDLPHTAPVAPPAQRALYKKMVDDKLYSKTYDEFKKQFSTPEMTAKLHQFLGEKGKYNKDLPAFNKQFFPDVPLQTTYNTQPTPDNNQLEKDSLIIAKLTTQKSDIEDKILTFKDQVKFGIVMTIIFSLFFFGFRYLFYAVKWSVKTLKQ